MVNSIEKILGIASTYKKVEAFIRDEVTMPPELRTAHRENDRAVMAAYGFPTSMTESTCVAELFKLYQALTK